jgi:ADP-heptose:LPS heptosyltransferase
VLAVRSDSDGDVLLTGPALRAIRAGASRLTLLCGPSGRAAAALLPGVDEIIEWPVPWIAADPDPVDPRAVQDLVRLMEGSAFDRAVVFTSYHQSPLPMALVLRLAGVGHISAISEDYPGSLLDVRHRVADDLPEAERARSLARAAGFPGAADDDGRLAVRRPLPDVSTMVGAEPYVVVHPGASVPARAAPPDRCREYIRQLAKDGWRVLVTGGPTEAAVTAYVAGRHGADLGGRTTLPELAAVLAGARCVVVGNTGPAHLAAAVGTPVVSLYAPTVPYRRWGPYAVPAVRLGDPLAPCRDSRARWCPVDGHPCLSGVEPERVTDAVRSLACGS